MKEVKGSSRRSFLGKWAAIAVACVMPGILAGCNGGNGGFTPPTQNGTFTGASANLGANRSGAFSLQSFTDNSVQGTLTVTATAAAVKKSTTSNGLVTLPTGTYNFTGTRSGNTFTGTGTIPGTSQTFNITGTLSTTSTAGAFTISGSLGGEAFSFGGTITVTTGGGGGGGNNTFTFTNSGSNANTASLTSIANVGTKLQIPGTNSILLSGTFTQATSATNVRIVTISVVKNSTTFSVGDTFTLSDDEGNSTSGTGTVLYTEGAPISKSWISHSGTVKVTAVSGNQVTLEIVSAAMEPSAISGPGQTNQATGQFTLKGSGTATYSGI